MNDNKKLKIIKNVERENFYNKIFIVWTRKKRELPNWMICFWCGKNINPKSYFDEKVMYFETTRDGTIFENPTYGKHAFNKMYQNTYRVEMCNYCYYNLDMFNKTGLWFEND